MVDGAEADARRCHSLDQRRSVTEKAWSQALKEFAKRILRDRCSVRMERGGVPFPVGVRPNCSGST